MAGNGKHLKSMRRKLIAYVLTIVITMVLMISALSWMQSRGHEEYQKNMSLLPLLEEMTKELDLKTENVKTLTERFHRANQTTVKLVEVFLRSGAFKELQEATDIISASTTLRSLTSNTGMYSMLIIDANGNLALMDTVDFYLSQGADIQYNVVKTDANPIGLFTPDQFSILTAAHDGWEGTSRTYTDGETEVNPVYSELRSSEGKDYNGYYYSTPLMNADGSFSGYYLIAMADSIQMEDDIKALKNIKTVLGASGVGRDGIVFSIDPNTGKFLYFEDKNGNVLTGEDYKGSGITDEIFQDGYSGMQAICGMQYYCVAKNYSSDVFGDCIVIVASIPKSNLYGSRASNVFWSVLAFFLVGFLILTFAIIIQIDQIRKGTVTEARRLLFTKKDGKEIYYNRVLGLRIFPLLVLGLAAIFGISVYTQTLTQLSSAVEISESRIHSIGEYVDANNSTADTITAFFEKQNLYKTRLLADILRRDPQLAFSYDMTDTAHYEYAKDENNRIVTDHYGNPVYTGRHIPVLQELCDDMDLSSIYIFNDMGRVIATNQPWWNFTLSDNPEDQSFPFRDVLVNTDFYVQDLQENDLGEMEQYIGCAYYYFTYDDAGTTRFVSEYEFRNGVVDENGTVIVPSSRITRHRGLVQTGVSFKNMQEVLIMASMEYTLSSMNMFYDGNFMSFADDAEHSILYSPFSSNTSVKIKDAMFSGGYNGYTTIDGQKYFSSIRKEGDIFIGTLIPAKTLFALRNNIALATVVISLVAFLNLLGFMLYSSNEEDEIIRQRIEESEEEQDSPIEGSANFDMKMPDGQKKRVKSASSRWKKRFTEWNKKSVEQKFSLILNGCGIILFLFVLGSVVLSRFLFSRTSIVTYIINGQLERSVNLFALTRCVIYFIMVLVGAKIAQRVINVLAVNLGTRAETIGHLLQSFIKYGGVIAILFYSLYLIGFNTTSLLTSAGILSLVVGLGAQSLISDILAGIFIVFEGEFRTGDIVTVGDFRGTVLEIGIRTTKIEDFLGNIKIFNNSSISGVLNMTKEYSTVPIELSIEYSESLERAETVLKEEFPAIRKKLNTIVNGPFYKGVSSLGDNSVNLLIVAQCLESDRVQLTRDLNRELYLAFTRNGINIPFPQVTVSYLENEDNKVSKKEAKVAEQFVEEQKEISAGVDSMH